MALSFTFTASEVATAMMIARLDKENPDNYLATATLVTTFTNILACVACSPLFAMSIIASKEQGKLTSELSLENKEKIANLRKKISDILKSGVILSTFIIPLPFAGLYFSKFILHTVFRQDEHISELAQQNLRAYSFAMPGFMYRMCFEQIMFSRGKTTPAMLIALSSFGIGTGLSYFLAFGQPNLSLAGIAYGYVAESYLTSLGFSLYLGHSKAFKDVKFFNFCQLDKGIIRQAKKILNIGWPITVQMTCELSAILLIGLFSGWIGNDPLAAQNFSTQLFIFAVIPSISFGQTVTQEVSRLLGQKDFKNAMRFSRYGLLTTLGIISTICIPISVSPELLTVILSMSVGPRAMRIAKNLIPLAATQTIYDTVGYGMTQVLRATNAGLSH